MTQPPNSWDDNAAAGGVPDPNPTPGQVPPGYPPAGGYPPPGPGFPPAGYASSEDKTWALIAHFGGAVGMFVGAGVGGWLPPLIAMLVRGNQSPTVRAHAVAALNFQLIWSIVGLAGWLLTCILIGLIGVVAAMILGIVFGIIAGLRANEGTLYKYPMAVSWIK